MTTFSPDKFIRACFTVFQYNKLFCYKDLRKGQENSHRTPRAPHYQQRVCPQPKITQVTTEYEWYIERNSIQKHAKINLPPCKQLKERLHLCTELLHFEFYGEARLTPVRSKFNINK